MGGGPVPLSECRPPRDRAPSTGGAPHSNHRKQTKRGEGSVPAQRGSAPGLTVPRLAAAPQRAYGKQPIGVLHRKERCGWLRKWFCSESYRVWPRSRDNCGMRGRCAESLKFWSQAGTFIARLIAFLISASALEMSRETPAS
jgi:hypothetical protein